MPCAKFPCDLHTHTVASDGNDTYAELIGKAAAAGLQIVAITDHDVVARDWVEEDGRRIPLAEYAAAKGVRVLRGIEFSCDTRVDDCHIVALGCDWDDPRFEEEYQRSIQSKVNGYRTLCELLTRDGMPVDWEQDVLGGRGEPIPESMVQRKMIFEAMASRGYFPDWSQAKLFIKGSREYNVPREKPDPLEIIRLIGDTGGIAILAHPYLIGDQVPVGEETLSRAEYIQRLIGAGLDGIEASYPYHKTSYKGEQTPQEIEAEVRARYGKRLSILSGGSDYHAEEKKGSKNPRQLGECGVTMEYFTQHPLLQKLL